MCATLLLLSVAACCVVHWLFVLRLSVCRFQQISHEDTSGKRAAGGGAGLNVSGPAKEEKGRERERGGGRRTLMTASDEPRIGLSVFVKNVANAPENSLVISNAATRTARASQVVPEKPSCPCWQFILLFYGAPVTWHRTGRDAWRPGVFGIEVNWVGCGCTLGNRSRGNPGDTGPLFGRGCTHHLSSQHGRPA